MNKMNTTIINFYKIFICILLFLFLSYTWVLKYYFPITLNSILLKSILIFSLLAQGCYFGRHLPFKIIVKLNHYLQKVYQKFYTEPITYFYEEYIQKMPKLGDNLFFFAKFFTDCCFMLGKKTTACLVFTFYILPTLFLLLSLLDNLFISTIPSKLIYLFIASTLLFLRITTLVIFVLHDFANKNMESLQTLLVITKVEGGHKYGFNYKTIKNPTQEKLTLYSTRYELFRSLDIFITAYYFQKFYIRQILQPFVSAAVFISVLNICFYSFHLSLDTFFNLLIFFILILSELYAIDDTSSYFDKR